MRTTISRAYHFEAAHHLPSLPDGHKCKRMHGHSYKVEIRIEGFVDEAGLVEGVEFGCLDDWFNPIIQEELDHRVWNDIIESPTVENIASYLMRRFWADWHIGGKVTIRVYEGPRSWAQVSHAE